ncbi:MAG: VWA domain-containing protein [Gammaproteobacteria bacterium]|nr:VWA domain-containing protein [Gammaproteobacteria bacterium]
MMFSLKFRWMLVPLMWLLVWHGATAAPALSVTPLGELVAAEAALVAPHLTAGVTVNGWLWRYPLPNAGESEVGLLYPPTGANWPARLHRFDPTPTCYALMIDNSQSMRPYWPTAIELLQQLLPLLPSGAPIALYPFAEALTPAVDFTTTADAPPLAETIAAITANGLDTQLYLALIHAQQRLADCPALRRQIILLSDGDAEDRARTLEQAISELQHPPTTLHTIGFGQANRSGTALKMEILRTLAAASGGSYHFYQNSSEAIAALSQALQQPLASGFIVAEALDQLPYQATTPMTLYLQPSGGERQEERVIVTGSDQIANLKVSLRHYWQQPFWQRSLSVAAVGLLLLLVILSLLRRRRRQQAAAQIAARQAENQQLQQAVAKLEQHLTPAVATARETVLGEGQPYGWLINTTGHRYPLIYQSTTLGRAASNDIVIEHDLTISSEHAIIDYKRGQFIWSDRAPLNPTRIAGVAIAGSIALHEGDRLECGQTLLTFELEK